MKESAFQTFAREWKEDIMEDGVAYNHKKMLAEWKAYKETLPQKPKGLSADEVRRRNWMWKHSAGCYKYCL